MAMIAEIIQSSLPSPVVVEVYPPDGETEADTEGVYVTWAPLYPAYDPIDLLEFFVYRDGDLYPLSYESLGSGVYRVFSHVGLFPDEGPIVIVASAQTQLGYKTITSWSFSTRQGMGAGEGTGSVNAKDPGGLVDLAHIDQAVAMTGEAVASALYGLFSGEGLGSLLAGDALGTEGTGSVFALQIETSATYYASMVFQVMGSDSAHAGTSPRVGYFGGDTLIDLLVGAPEVYDTGIARLTRIEVMDPQVATHKSLELGDPQEPVESLSSTQVKGLVRADVFILAALLSGKLRENLGGAGSLELAKVVTVDGSPGGPTLLSCELGSPVDGSYPVSVQVQRGAGVLIFLDLLSGVLAKLRE